MAELEKQAWQDWVLLKAIGEPLLCVQWKTLEDLNRKVMWITFFLKIILDFGKMKQMYFSLSSH